MPRTCDEASTSTCDGQQFRKPQLLMDAETLQRHVYRKPVAVVVPVGDRLWGLVELKGALGSEFAAAGQPFPYLTPLSSWEAHERSGPRSSSERITNRVRRCPVERGPRVSSPALRQGEGVSRKSRTRLRELVQGIGMHARIARHRADRREGPADGGQEGSTSGADSEFGGGTAGQRQAGEPCSGYLAARARLRHGARVRTPVASWSAQLAFVGLLMAGLPVCRCGAFVARQRPLPAPVAHG
jgi:hypothetical protein